MATMTISEAEHIIDVLAAAFDELEKRTSGNRDFWKQEPPLLSNLQGYDVFHGPFF